MFILDHCGVMLGPHDVCPCTEYTRRTVVPEKLGQEIDEAIDRAEASCVCGHSRAMHLTALEG